jgi:hypothetical protein
MPKLDKPVCMNVKSRKFPQERCKYPATKGEYCCRHWKHPRRYGDQLKIASPVTRSVQIAARKIQTWWKLRYGIYIVRKRSLAFFNRDICHNSTELASFEPLKDIPRDYFFIVKDQTRFWGFDIRTLVTQYESEGRLENPYTKDICNSKTVEEFRLHVECLRRWKKPIHYETYSNLTPAQSWSLRVLDICLRLDMLGYRIATQWFTDLDLVLQRALYARMYHIWNDQLSQTTGLQDRLVPGHATHANRLFKWTPEKINLKSDLDSVRRTNLNVVERLISSATTQSDKVLGAMYTVMALSHVSERCRRSYAWLL